MSTQDVLLIADVFITDYSSAVFEAAVAGVPSYLIAPDVHEYAERRDFYVDYPDDLGLPMAAGIGELVTMIQAGPSDLSTIMSFIAESDSASSTGATDHLATQILSAAHLPGLKEPVS